MEIVVIVISVLAVVAVIAWFVLGRRNPERAASHPHEHEHEPSRSRRLYDGADRPAGPDAEVMDPEQLGGDHRPPSR